MLLRSTSAISKLTERIKKLAVENGAIIAGRVRYDVTVKTAQLFGKTADEDIQTA